MSLAAHSCWRGDQGKGMELVVIGCLWRRLPASRTDDLTYVTTQGWLLGDAAGVWGERKANTYCCFLKPVVMGTCASGPPDTGQHVERPTALCLEKWFLQFLLIEGCSGYRFSVDDDLFWGGRWGREEIESLVQSGMSCESGQHSSGQVGKSKAH